MGGRHLRFQPRELLLEGPDVVEDLSDFLRQFLRLGLQSLRGLSERRLLLLHPGERALARGRLDAAHPRRHAALGHDLEKPDVAGARHVRAAAQLARGTDVEHAHLVAVLFAEQRHGAALDCVVELHDARRSRLVPEDFGVNHRLDASDLLVGHRLVVRKVEARFPGVHERPLLLHVRPQHLAQRLVHQVSGRMIAHGALAPRRVHARRHLVAHGEPPGRERAVVAEHVGLDLLRVGNGEGAARRDELARVADLAARFGVERGLVQHHDRGVARGDGWHRSPFLVEGRHFRVIERKRFVAAELGGAP